MKNILSAFLLTFTSTLASAQGYEIKVTLKPFKNEKIYLAYHYGDIKGLADSAMLDANSNAVFKGEKLLPPGIYMMVSPAKVILFEMLIDKPQQFSVSADTADLKKVVYTGSPDNTAFRAYQTFTDEKGKILNQLRGKQKISSDAAEIENLQQQMRALSKEIENYRTDYVKKYPSGMLSALFNALREPVVPPANQHPGGKYDSAFAYRYYKSHYWDGIHFGDDRLVRTPFFKPKLKKYYEQLVSPEPDSIIVETDHMLQEATGTQEMFKFLLSEFIDKYINPEFMGQDKVFIYLFEKYINAGQATWLSEKQRKYINERAYSLMANQLGLPASPLDLVDTTGKKRPLYEVKAPYTVVVFWDPTCGHCKEVVPKVDSMYNAKWKNSGIAVYGVMVDGGLPAWKTFINEHKLTGWTHVYQTEADREADYNAGRPNYRQLYDVYQTPVLYLLDENKRIVAKKLTYDQVDKVIEMKKK